MMTRGAVRGEHPNAAGAAHDERLFLKHEMPGKDLLVAVGERHRKVVEPARLEEETQENLKRVGYAP